MQLGRTFHVIDWNFMLQRYFDICMRQASSYVIVGRGLGCTMVGLRSEIQMWLQLQIK